MKYISSIMKFIGKSFIVGTLLNPSIIVYHWEVQGVQIALQIIIGLLFLNISWFVKLIDKNNVVQANNIEMQKEV